MAQPLSSELTHCSLLPLLEKNIRGRKKTECTEKEENEDFLTNLHGGSNLIFPQGAAS